MAEDRITWMHSGQLGAPQMNGAAGSNGQMLQVLDACLADGFNPQTVTAATKTATTVTLTFGVSHGYIERQLLLITGATDAALNGKHRVIAATTNTVTIDAVGITATTGAITTKVAPLGFESIFGSTDPLKRAYRSQNMQTTQTVLYLDMTIPASSGYHATNPLKRAIVSMCEDMTTLGTQINSYTDAKNNFAANANGAMFWYQARSDLKTSEVTASANLKWVLFGNGDYFYFLPAWQTYNLTATRLLQRDLFGFGDIKGFDENNSYSCFWVGAYGDNDSQKLYQAANGGRINGDPSYFKYDASQAGAAGFFIKPTSGVGGLEQFSLVTTGILDLSRSNQSGINFLTSLNYVAFPNLTSQTLLSSPLYACVKNSNFYLRSEMGCLRAIPQDLKENQSLDLNVVDDVVIVAVAANGVYDFRTGFLAIDTRG